MDCIWHTNTGFLKSYKNCDKAKCTCEKHKYGRYPHQAGTLSILTGGQTDISITYFI